MQGKYSKRLLLTLLMNKRTIAVTLLELCDHKLQNKMWFFFVTPHVWLKGNVKFVRCWSVLFAACTCFTEDHRCSEFFHNSWFILGKSLNSSSHTSSFLGVLPKVTVRVSRSLVVSGVLF